MASESVAVTSVLLGPAKKEHSDKQSNQNGHTKKLIGSVADEKCDNSSDLRRVQRKWQLASCAHFLEVFRNILPIRKISVDTAEDLSPALLEQAIVNPARNLRACLALRDVIMSLLIVLEEASLKNVSDSWFNSLTLFVESRRSMFLDCLPSSSSALSTTPPGSIQVPISHNITKHATAEQESILKKFDDGILFLSSVTWPVRLGLLSSLCDIAAEESEIIRDAIKDAELTKPEAPSTMAPTPLPAGHAKSDNVNGTADMIDISTVDTGSSKNGNTNADAKANPDTDTHSNATDSVPVPAPVPVPMPVPMPVQAPTVAPPLSSLEDRGIRLRPIGRCSRKRSFYMVGKSRLYSGYRHKGSGGLIVECSDSQSMLKLASALESTKHPRDMQLAADVRGKYLQPLLQQEERQKKAMERKRLEEVQREETRLRNAHRPRRKAAAYI